MPTEPEITQHRKVQIAARAVLSQITTMITADDTEKSIADKAHHLLKAQGYPDTWYYTCPALVLLGSRSCVSISGKDYQPHDECVGHSNLVTIDLSPTLGPYWGDCARSFPIENGRVTSNPKQLEFQNGLNFLDQMHLQMQKLVKPHTTFGQLFDWANMRIRQSGFVNLDYRNNVGHSIAADSEQRQFIETTNSAPLGNAPFFSFEPFVRLKGGKWGFKREEIFYFDETGVLREL
ncbi:M24 family metallopeptidase [Undibacterium oligocarboniphilum]|uniref:Aminopeptidase P family protein n=1 Tax=Undibacterium oligocarboniphilum TaxID=666702 RepID=A0A850QIV8_9BURK|nr:M24 family metallopeptidase [Undibacterium oligocarboniphilum]MBC3871232.1 aminopeptidase P family protein [Undibacterium oligocarboniphilum]NVO79208.1 aminopeptidase P family protein [Undibacterium oligocarboniphilum]